MLFDFAVADPYSFLIFDFSPFYAFVSLLIDLFTLDTCPQVIDDFFRTIKSLTSLVKFCLN